jgi:hypothetical protein
MTKDFAVNEISFLNGTTIASIIAKVNVERPGAFDGIKILRCSNEQCSNFSLLAPHSTIKSRISSSISSITRRETQSRAFFPPPPSTSSTTLSTADLI